MFAHFSHPVCLPTMRLAFTKMHGLGNDFIVFDAPAEAALPSAAALRRLADRHTGIGFDQALALAPPRAAGTDVFYRIFNSDGSEVEQCANGARCIASLVARRLGRSSVQLDSPGGRISRRAACRRQRVARHGRAELRSRVVAVRGVARGRHLSAARRRAGAADRRGVDGQSARGHPGAFGARRARGHSRPRCGESFPLSTPHQRRLHGSGQPGAHPVARLRARRRRDAGVRHRRLRRGGGRAQARAVAGKSAGRCARWRHDRALGGPGEHLWLTGPAVSVFEGTVDVDATTTHKEIIKYHRGAS